MEKPSNPIQEIEEVTPLLISILQTNSGTAVLLRQILWSIWNDSPVGLSRLASFDETRKPIARALINLRMELGGQADEQINKILEASGEWDRMQQAQEKARQYGYEHTFYPATPEDPDKLFRMARTAEKIEADSRAQQDGGTSDLIRIRIPTIEPNSPALKEEPFDKYPEKPLENSGEKDSSGRIVPFPKPSVEIIRLDDIGFCLTDDDGIIPWESDAQKLAFKHAEMEASKRGEEFSPEKFLEDWEANPNSGKGRNRDAE